MKTTLHLAAVRHMSEDELQQRFGDVGACETSITVNQGDTSITYDIGEGYGDPWVLPVVQTRKFMGITVAFSMPFGWFEVRVPSETFPNESFWDHEEEGANNSLASDYVPDEPVFPYGSFPGEI